MELLVSYGGERIVIEFKRIPTRGSARALRDERIANLAGYLDQQGLNEGWLCSSISAQAAVGWSASPLSLCIGPVRPFIRAEPDRAAKMEGV